MYFLPFGYVDYQEGDENISLESFGPGDLPELRIYEVTDQEVQFRLKNGGQSYFIEFSRDMKLWQRATVSNAESEGAEWTNLTVPRGEDVAGFYRAVMFSEQ